MCATVLGKPLSKVDRMSNWEQRPLSERQLVYASLDAHALVALFDRLLEVSVYG